MSSSSLFARTLVGAIQVCVMVACGGASDTPLAPSAQHLRVEVAEGASQYGFIGELLERPVTVQLVDSAGHSIGGQRRVRFSVVRGGGSVSDTTAVTSAQGRAGVNWRLGPTPGSQELAVRLAESGIASSAASIIDAWGIESEKADLVVVSGMKGGTVGVLIQQDAVLETHTLVWPDTVLRFLPRGPEGTWQQVTAFSIGHPPEARIRPWTDGVDTIRLALREPIRVPFTVWALLDFDTTAAKAQLDLADLDYTWQRQATGLRVGTVRIERAPNARDILGCASDTHGFVDPAAINVYYTAAVAEVGGSGGVNCSPSKILIGPNAPLGFRRMPDYLLAHEAGHALSLDHVSIPSNVMMPSSVVASDLTTGQIYWMHFDRGSALNAVLGIHPAAEHNCRAPLVAYCPKQEYVAW
jgi:hypothetical protein